MGSHFVAIVLLVLATMTTADAAVLIEKYDSRAMFEARLGNVAVVDFDDVTTSSDEAVSIASDRYAAQGIVILGETGQYVSRTFGFANDYPPRSSPNMYAPGPIESGFGGGNTTDVRFRTGGIDGAVAGFGAVFIDVDSQDLIDPFPSSLAAFDGNNVPRGSVDVEGGSMEAVFRGIVTVDSATGNPVPVIARVHLTNGSGWPGGANQGVPLDDFVFAAPATTTTTTTVSATTSTTLLGCPETPLPRCRQSLTSGAARLAIVKSNNRLRDALAWRWTHGDAADGELRQATNRDAFLCLYDGTGAQLDVTIPGAALCGTRACWRATGKRVVYRDQTQSRGGVVQVLLIPGAPGKSKAQIAWLAQGARLQTPALPLTTPVTVQMISGGDCFGAVFSVATKNATSRFRARSD